MLEAEWVGRAELVVCGFGQCSTGQGKAGQSRTGQDDDSDILVDRTRVSAMCICPISQHTFFWLNFLAYNFSSSSFQYIFLISFSEAMNAVTEAVQLSCL